MVDHEERDAVLAKLSGSKESRTIVHVGGHFVPVNDEMVGHVVDFIAKCSNSTTSDSSDSAEDSAYEAIK
jgi:hypothetical protein